MWFSYPMDDTWVPLEINRVKEIQQQNKEGIIPADLGELKEPEGKLVKEPDYENVVGQDSLTRLDDRNRNKKKNKNRNKNQGNRPQQAPAGVAKDATQIAQPRSQDGQDNAAKADGAHHKNRNNRRFRPNKNRPNRNDQNKGNESGS